MTSPYLPWLLAALAGVAALVLMDDPPDSNDKIVAASGHRVSSMKLRAILPRKGAGNIGNADLFGVAPSEASTVVPSVTAPVSRQNERQLLEQPTWKLIGKYLDAPSGWAVFLVRNEQTRIVHAGDLLDDGYRIERIDPPLMALRHVQRNTRKTLDIGEPAK